MKTQLNNLQQMLDQSNLEKTLLMEAKPETAETETQTDKIEDSFFRNDTTMTPDGVTVEQLQNLVHEAVDLADQKHKAKEKLQQEFNELKAGLRIFKFHIKPKDSSGSKLQFEYRGV